MAMINERKTEKIVRNMLSSAGYDSKDIIIEEQASENPSISKLLKNASKKGVGVGRPEFIIRSSKKPNFLIVIECKADEGKHESVSRDKYAEYAVDGVLLYTSFLAKEYDVLAIAVSGETKSKLKVSHFIHPKEAPSCGEYFKNIRANKYRYSYGRQANRTLRAIMVPSRDSIPSWVYSSLERVCGQAKATF